MRTRLNLVLSAMLDDLLSHQLDVQLAPAPDPRHEMHFVRVVCDRNPKWYREFCDSYRSQRNGKPRTAIKRRETLSAIGALLDGRLTPIYGRRLLAAALRYYRQNRNRINEEASWLRAA
jgi:hypothetical protein